jgi:hypothetical protein
LDKGKVLQDTYDGIVFLDSAAEWAEEFYKIDKERTESLSEAQDNNRRLKTAYIGTEKYRQQNNKQFFEQKITGTTHDVINMIWLPVPLEIEDKFAVKSIDKDVLRKMKSPISHIEQFYLNSLADTGIHRARKLMQWLFTGYFHTIKWPQKYLEREKKLTSQEYSQYALMQALNTDKIIKNREYFLYDDQYFSFDTFTYPRNKLQPGDIW